MPYTERLGAEVFAEVFGDFELAFDDFVDQFHAGHDPPGIEEALERKHRPHPGLDAPMVLLHHVVQVRARANLDGILLPKVELVIHAHPT
jgi:hypothetical protein